MTLPGHIMDLFQTPSESLPSEIRLCDIIDEFK